MRVSSHRFRLLLAGALVSVSASQAMAAADCSPVVEATLDEMRAGASEAFGEDVERMLRAAAGSACVKALSGRFQAGEVSSVAITPTNRTPAAKPSSTPSVDDEPESTGFSLKPLTGSPTKKPYERARSKKD